MFEIVEFPSQGAVLRGRLHRPQGPRPAPVVVMAHGTSATIGMTTDRYAAVFEDAGFAVLLYDHRNFGDSGGEPRQEINPWVQARGYRDAMTFVETVDRIDAGAIAIWGDSYSAAEVLVVGAVDDRPAAVVAQIPAIGPAPPPPDPDGALFTALRHTLLHGEVGGGPEDEMPGASPQVSRAAYAAAPGPKELLEIAGGHFGLLHHPSDLFDEASRAQCDFLLRTLR